MFSAKSRIFEFEGQNFVEEKNLSYSAEFLFVYRGPMILKFRHFRLNFKFVKIADKLIKKIYIDVYV